MRAGFYPKLAWEGIRKNKRLYFPYILTGLVMVMMYYILSFLGESPALAQMPGGSVLMSLLPLGCVVIAVFSLLFLFYTNSFLIKQRYREFGLYNILGMDKRNIGRVMIWETIFTAIFAILTGLIAGVSLSKTAELVLLNMLHMEVSYHLSLGFLSLCQTVIIYGGIYLLLLLHSLIKVWRCKPLELMQSSKVGEKIPKCTGLFALIGAFLLGYAYYLAISIKEPLTALFTFFIAVVLVIIGTYLLFLSGSVAFCRLLQKNKRYYYQPNHFVSVSSMVYRMKRNGAGLASICILLTMVLVMISSSASLYFGEEDSIRNRYQNGINIKINYDNIDCIREEPLNMLRKEIAESCGTEADLTGLRACAVPGLFTEEGIIINVENAENFSGMSYDNLGYLYVLSLEDYNHRMKEAKSLADDECLLYCDRLSTQWDTFTAEYGKTYQVKERLTEYKVDGDSLAMTIPSVYLVVKDLYSFAEPIKDRTTATGESFLDYEWSCGFDTETAAQEILARNDVYQVISAHAAEDNSLIHSFYVQSRELQRGSFFEMYGSLFFLGIMLSIVFLLAAVLIIYYKQISEGYEDQSRFEIMQKVGMTKRDIRKSINSQMLTVFFMPLVMAGIHLAFAYPFVSKILLMFAFDNTLLNILVNLICFGIFGILYAIVYKITSSSYYTIVSGRKER